MIDRASTRRSAVAEVRTCTSVIGTRPRLGPNKIERGTSVKSSLEEACVAAPPLLSLGVDQPERDGWGVAAIPTTRAIRR
jgi:hypothetical protein